MARNKFPVLFGTNTTSLQMINTQDYNQNLNNVSPLFGSLGSSTNEDSDFWSSFESSDFGSSFDSNFGSSFDSSSNKIPYIPEPKQFVYSNIGRTLPQINQTPAVILPRLPPLNRIVGSQLVDVPTSYQNDYPLMTNIPINNSSVVTMRSNRSPRTTVAPMNTIPMSRSSRTTVAPMNTIPMSRSPRTTVAPMNTIPMKSNRSPRTTVAPMNTIPMKSNRSPRTMNNSGGVIMRSPKSPKSSVITKVDDNYMKVRCPPKESFNNLPQMNKFPTISNVPNIQYNIPTISNIPNIQYNIPTISNIPNIQYNIPTTQYNIPTTQYNIPTTQYNIPNTQYVPITLNKQRRGRLLI